MIKRFILGAALGVIGKKLYDEGRLDPYIAKAKTKFDDLKTEATEAATTQTGNAAPQAH